MISITFDVQGLGISKNSNNKIASLFRNLEPSWSCFRINSIAPVFLREYLSASTSSVSKIHLF